MPTFRIANLLNLATVASFLVGCCAMKDPMHLALTRDHNAEAELAFIQDPREIPESLTLEEIIDIAIARNLDLMVKELEFRIQQEKITGETLKMLPAFNLTKEASWRNKRPITLNTTTAGATPTQSSSRRVNRWDASGTWYLVDFGISYFRSRQEQKKAVGMGFQYDRAKQNLILDVTKAYWKAIAAKRAIENSLELLEIAKQQEERYLANYEHRNLSQFQGLEAETKLIALELQLTRFQNDLDEARAELAALMGISPCTPFELAPVREDAQIVDIGDVCCLETVALHNRPELFSSDMDERILADEARIAIISMFPPAAPFAGYNGDYDRFLVNHHWIIYGMRATWNLLAIPQHLSDAKIAMHRKTLTKETRLALAMGIIAQLHIANVKYEEALTRYKLYQRILKNRAELYEASLRELEYGEGNLTEVLGYQTDFVIAQIETVKSYGDVQVALELINNSLGIPGYFSSKNSCDTSAIDLALEATE